MKEFYVTILSVLLLVNSVSVVDSGDAYGPNLVGVKVTRFYPNPATTVINFEFDKSVNKTYTLQVYNFIGRKMTEVRVTDPKITINLDENYLRGLYIYQLRDASTRIIESGKFQVSK